MNDRDEAEHTPATRLASEPANARCADAAPRRAPQLVLGAGARATEHALLAAVARYVAETRENPALLATPVRVVVSSRSLREHVVARIVEQCGAVAGVTVQTLQALAREVLERAGRRVADGDALFPLLVRRAVMTESVLRELLADLDDGAGAAVGTIADLLDAGLDAEAAAATDEALAACDSPHGLRPQDVERARALVRAAGVVDRALAALGSVRNSGRLTQARDCLGPGNASLLPARAILIHGFADATRVGLDLIETLVRHHDGTVFVDQPPDPASGQPDAAAARFSENLLRAVSALGAVEHAASIDPAPSACDTIDLLTAPGAEAEVRAVATRIRALLEAKMPAESIGVVARRLDSYVIPLRRHFTRLGIPFSISAPAPIGAAERRVGAIVRLLRDGEQASVDVLLDAASIRANLKPDLRVACHSVGAARVRDVAALDVESLVDERRELRLPVPYGRAAGAARETASDSDEASGSEVESADERPERLRARVVGAADLAVLVSAAREIVAAMDGEDADRSREPEAIAAILMRVFDALTLDREVEVPLLNELRERVARTMAGLPPVVAPTLGEAVSLVERDLQQRSRAPAGGAGGGVAVLDAMAARARTFSHLFVIGLGRDVFPRIVREDPLLPDLVRARIRASTGVELGCKDVGYDEERWLFASLLSAAPAITLSWQRAGDDGRPRPASPLLESLRLRLPNLPLVEAPSLRASLPAQGERAQTAHEHAVLAALHVGRATLAHTLPLALAEATQDPAAASRSLQVAAAQCALLDEFDPPLEGAFEPGPGPWYGFVGASADSSREPFYVTRAESLARCGWRDFLERSLGLEPPPDALAALPEIEARTVGSAVHQALERWLSSLGVPAHHSLAEIVLTEGVPLHWPDEETSWTLAVSASRVALGAAAAALPGFATLLAERVVQVFRALRESELSDSNTRVLGSEVEAVCRVSDAGGGLAVRFRADLVTREHGSLRLIDLKTGSPGAKTPDAVLQAVQQGALLQGAIYSRAAGELDGAAAAGRYLHVQRAVTPIDLPAGDAARDAALERTLLAIATARQAGARVPRLIDANGDQPRICAYCDVAEACVRGDSAARQRLRHWRDRAREVAPASDVERAALGLFTLGAEESER